MAAAQWEDITGANPLTLINDCVQFTTNISARYTLYHLCSKHHDCAIHMLTVGLVKWPVKIVPYMTYNVFGGTLNLAQSINHMLILCDIHCVPKKVTPKFKSR